MEAPQEPEDRFNIVCSAIGGFIALFGLVSFFLKESLFISEPLVAVAAGVILSPYALNLARPIELAGGSQQAVETATLCFTRLVLGVQVAIAGVQLPSKYPRKEWRSLAILLGPNMLAMWLATSLLVWAVVPGIEVVGAMVIGACVTPTDPVLSNSIVHGPFADKHMPEPLRMVIVGESGANDGLGYFFLFLPLYLIKHAQEDEGTRIGNAVLSFLGLTVGREVLLGAAYGVAIGWAAKYVLYWSEQKNYIDEESFHFFVIAFALFIIGTAGLLEVDDIFACFIGAVVFTWDDWFTEQTKEDNTQPIMDFLLSVTIFMWLGASCPWDQLFNMSVVSWPRLLLLGVLVLTFRRLPSILALHFFVPQIASVRHAAIMGFFGPIGISAIFYLYKSREFLMDNGGDEGREDMKVLADQTLVVVWFLVFSSVIVHGLAIPAGHLWTWLFPGAAEWVSVKFAGTKSGEEGEEDNNGSADNGERAPLLP